MKLLYLVWGYLKLTVIFWILINFEDDFLPELLNLLPFFEFIPKIVLLDWCIILSMPWLLMVVIKLLTFLTQDILDLVFKLPDPIGKL